MKSPWTILISCFIAVAVLFHACKRPASPLLANVEQLVPINGQVFVVTRGAENIRLGQLTVFLAPLEHFRSLRLGELLEKQLQELREQFRSGKKLGRERESTVTEIKNNYAVLVQERDRLVSALPAMSAIHERYDRVLAEIRRRDDQLDKYSNELRQLGESSYSECEDIIEKISDMPQAVARHSYQNLISRSTSCKTDADGRFHFECPIDRDVVIFTRGERYLPAGNTEKYQWFVRARPQRDSARQILLTNDNLIDGSAPENLFAEIIKPGEMTGADFDVPVSQDRMLPQRKPLPREPRWASPGTFYLLQYVSVSTATGVIGLPPGTELRQISQEGGIVTAKAGDFECQAGLSVLTDNLDLSDRARRADYNAQAEIARWQGQQAQAEQSMIAEENRRSDEVQRRLDAAYRRMHSLTGESRLNEPPHR